MGAVPADNPADIPPSVLPDRLRITTGEASTFTVYLGSGADEAASATVTSLNSSIASIVNDPTVVTVSGTAITVRGMSAGNTAISISYSGGTRDSQSDMVNVEVIGSTATYAVTVQNDGRGTGYASPTPAGEGDTVTLTATPVNSYYYFSHWEVISGGVNIAGDQFTMPGHGVTVKAHFARYSYSSGSSDNGSKPVVTPAVQPDRPTIGSVSGKAAGSKTQKTFTITDSLVKAALEKAQAEAKAQNRTAYGIGIRITLDTPSAAGLTLTLERGALNRLVSMRTRQFEITGIPVEMIFDTKALTEMKRQGTGDVTITIKPVTAEGVRNAYDIRFTIEKNGKTVRISSIGTGSATLAIPCTPDKNEAAGYLYAVYVDTKGKVNRIADSLYDANSGNVIFAANHFSVYGVGYAAPSVKYIDTAGHWAEESMDYAAGRGLLTGTAETTFAPDAAITRELLVTALGRLTNVDTEAYTADSFNDVKADSTFRPYIEWACEKGIIQGTGYKRFEPGRAITREEIAVIFANFADATGYTLPVTRTAAAYADASDIGSAYEEAVTAMQQAGIMMGGTNNKFNPKSGTTRAEVCAMLHRYIKLAIDPDTAQGWTKNDAGQYLYYKDGKAVTGTQLIDGVKYFFNTDGTLKTGWIQDNSGNR